MESDLLFLSHEFTSSPAFMIFFIASTRAMNMVPAQKYGPSILMETLSASSFNCHVSSGRMSSSFLRSGSYGQRPET